MYNIIISIPIFSVSVIIVVSICFLSLLWFVCSYLLLFPLQPQLSSIALIIEISKCTLESVGTFFAFSLCRSFFPLLCLLAVTVWNEKASRHSRTLSLSSIHIANHSTAPMKASLVVALLCLSVWTSTCFGWGEEGHKIVAQLASNRLSSAAAAIVRVSRSTSFVQWSPDLIIDKREYGII